MGKRVKSRIIEDLSSDSSDSEEEWNSKSKPTKKKHAKKRSKLQSDSEPEEGEVSSEDVGENDDDNGGIDDGLDDNLIGDEDDRKRLEKMSEREREEELFKRVERRDAMKARQAVKKKLMERKKEKAEKDKASSSKKAALSKSAYSNIFGSDSGEESASSSEQTPTMDRKKALDKKKEEKNSKFQELIALRNQKQKALMKTSEVYSDDDDDKKSSSSSLSSSSRKNRSSRKTKIASKKKRSGSISSSSSSSDVERGRSTDSSRSRSPDKPIEYVSTKEDLSKIRLSRHKLEHWVHMPFFKELIVGCFVRVNIGNNQGMPIYRCAEIVDVVETVKIYELGTTRTNKGLKLRIGLSVQMFRLMFASNQDFTEQEFQSWYRKTQDDGIDLPTLSFIEKKANSIKDAQQYSIKDEKVLNEIIESKKRFQKNPHNYAMRKSELLKLKEDAEIKGDNESARKHTEELDELECNADRIDRRRSAGIKSITSINQRNRQLNLKKAEEAIKQELAEYDPVEDPFNRINTQPVMMNKQIKEQLRLKRELQKQKDTPKDPTLPTPVSVANKEEPSEPITSEPSKPLVTVDLSESLASLKTAPVSNSMHSIHDFEINIDFDDAAFGPSNPSNASLADNNSDMNASRTNSMLSLDSTLAPPQNRRSLNLSEYKKMRGLI